MVLVIILVLISIINLLLWVLSRGDLIYSLALKRVAKGFFLFFFLWDLVLFRVGFKAYMKGMVLESDLFFIFYFIYRGLC